MPRVLWTIKAIENLTDEDIGKMKEPEIERLVNATRKQVERRVKRIEKAGLYSHAVASYEKELAPGSVSPLNDPRVMTLNQLRQEMARHKAFLGSQTSTVKGIREVNRQQDLRIFGPKRPGGKTPKRTMTEEERKQYWALYNEFESQHRNAAYDSNRAQQVISQEISNLGQNATFGAVLNNASIRLEMEGGPIYHGGRRMSYDTLMSAYTPGEHDLDYWRDELDSYF